MLIGREVSKSSDLGQEFLNVSLYAIGLDNGSKFKVRSTSFQREPNRSTKPLRGISSSTETALITGVRSI
jgi:hypothetical protein